jgi:hypothetical protein
VARSVRRQREDNAGRLDKADYDATALFPARYNLALSDGLADFSSLDSREH